MKKLLAILVFALALLPAANAALPDVYVSQFSATYTIKEHSYLTVDEYLTFTNNGGPYRTTLELERGDAWGVEVEGAEFDLIKEGGSTTIVLKPYLKLKSGTIALHYSRTDMLSKKGVIGLFNGSVIEGYPWYLFDIEVRFLLPQNHQSEIIYPQAIPGYLEIEKSSTHEEEKLTYTISYLAPNNTLPIMFEYEDYEALSLEKISVAKTLIDGAHYDINRAGEAISSANAFGVNVTPLITLYNESINFLEDSKTYVGVAEKEFSLGKVDRARFQSAYEEATKAEESARASEQRALKALDTANSEVQGVLKGRVSEFNEELLTLEANLTSLESTLVLRSQALEEQLSQQAERLDEVSNVAMFQRAAQRVTFGMILGVIVAIFAYFALRDRLRRSVAWRTFKEEYAGKINEGVVIIIFFIASIFVMNAAFVEPLSNIGDLRSDPLASNEQLVKVGGYLRSPSGIDFDLSAYIDFGADVTSYILETKDGEIPIVYPEGANADRRAIVTGVFFSREVQFKDVPDTEIPVDSFIYATEIKPSHIWNERGLSDSSFYMIFAYIVAVLLAGGYDFYGKHTRRKGPAPEEDKLSRLKEMMDAKEKAEPVPERVVETEERTKAKRAPKKANKGPKKSVKNAKPNVPKEKVDIEEFFEDVDELFEKFEE